MKEYGGCLHFEILESIGQAKGGYYAAFQEHKVDVDWKICDPMDP